MVFGRLFGICFLRKYACTCRIQWPEAATLQDEMDVVVELIRQAISQNTSMTLNQEDN